MRPTPVDAHGTVEHEWVGSGSRPYVLSPARRVSRFSPGPIPARCSERGQKTWCGWKFTLSEECEMSIWDGTLAKPEFRDRCFGKKPKPDDPSSASSGSSS